MAEDTRKDAGRRLATAGRGGWLAGLVVVVVMATSLAACSGGGDGLYISPSLGTSHRAAVAVMVVAAQPAAGGSSGAVVATSHVAGGQAGGAVAAMAYIQATPAPRPLAATSTPPVAPPLPPAAPAQTGPAGTAQRVATDFDVRGLPSISVATIERVLTEYGSPMIGEGQTIYDLGVQYGIDPAFALAFYVHESSAGTQGMARDTGSFGNIRCVKEYKCHNVNGGYAKYDSHRQAIEHWYKLITGELYIGDGLTTPALITPRYAPWGDNNSPTGYAHTVERLVTEWRGEQP